MNFKSGYSLIEVIVVVAFIVILLGISVGSMMSFSENQILDQTVQEIVTIISDSQHQAQTGASFENNLLSVGAMVSGNGLVQFSTTDGYGQRLPDFDYEWSWPGQIVCQEINLPASCLSISDCIIFAKGSGLPTGGGTFKCRDNNTSQSRTINILANGLVTYQ